MVPGTPLQYSCLENPMDEEAWWAAVHGVAKSWTWLSDFTFTSHFHALEKEMATHSSVLGWKIPGMGEPGGLPSMGSHRVGHDWSNLLVVVVFSFGESHGQRNLEGYSPWGHKELATHTRWAQTSGRICFNFLRSVFSHRELHVILLRVWYLDLLFIMLENENFHCDDTE